jgi:hypothetical protein
MFDAEALGADGNTAVRADLDGGAKTPNIRPPRTSGGWAQDRSLFFLGAVPGLLGRHAEAGHTYGRHRIARLMRLQGLCGRAKGRFRVCTNDSNHDQPIAPNRLPDLPAPSAANQVWLGDITYVATVEGWLYLAGILDLYSRRLTTTQNQGTEGGIVSKASTPIITGSRLGMTVYQATGSNNYLEGGFYVNGGALNTVVEDTKFDNNAVGHHGVYVNDGTNVQLFVDGQLVGSTSYPPQDSTSVTSTQPMLIGKEFPTNYDGSGTRNFNGVIGDVRVYNRALSSCEAAKLYAIESGLLSIRKAVYLDTYNLFVGSNYQVQVSSDLMNWTNYGRVFTATNAYWRSTNYWDVENWNQLFFRMEPQ